MRKRAHEQEHGDEQPRRRAKGDVVSSERCRSIDFAELRKEAERRDAAGAEKDRTMEESPMKRAHVRMLQRFSVEAEVMKQKDPAKFSAVERDVEKLREVKNLADATVLKAEIVKHAGRMAAEADMPTRQRLYTRTLALAALHQEQLDMAERKETPRIPMHAARERSTTTEPLRLFVDPNPKPRPLPDLASFAERDPTPSPLERRVQKLFLPPTQPPPVPQERDTDPVREETSRVFASFASRDTAASPLLARSHGFATEAREIEISLSDVAHVRAVEEVREGDTRLERGKSLQVREVFRDAETVELPPRPRVEPDVRYADERRKRENDREAELVRSVYASERKYLDVRLTDPERSARVAALASTLKFAPEFRTREQALSMHGQAWQRRAAEKDVKLWRAQEDNLMGIALVARERDDQHHAVTRNAKERLADEGRQTQGPERVALKEELRAFLQREFSLDAQACRREMNEAMNHEPAGDDPRVYALALETHPHRPFRSPDDDRRRPVPAPVFDEERTQIGQVDIDRLKSELVDLRVSYALRELSYQGVLRAERVMQVIDAAAARTAEEAV